MTAQANSLLPPQASPLERALEAVHADRMDGLAAEGLEVLATVRDPLRCPEAFLPLLAWEYDTQPYDPGWPEATRREAIRGSIDDWRIRGTRGAVEQILNRNGALFDLVENFGAEHHSAKLSILNTATLANVLLPIVDQLDAVKRLSVHLQITFHAGACVDIAVAAAALVATSVRAHVTVAV